MRVAQLMLARGFGGAERSFVDLSRALAAGGHQVLAIGDKRGTALGRLAGHAGIACCPLCCYGTWDRLAAGAIRRALEHFQPAVVHTHLARAAHLAGPAAHALGLPAVAKTHNLVDLKYYRHIDCLVPTTLAQERYLIAAGVAPAALTRIPNFSAVEPVAGVAGQRAAPPYRIAALGRLVHKKGFDTLVAAVAALNAAGLAVTLELAGDGPERRHLARQIDSAGCGGQIRLSGWVDDVPAFLAGADLFVLPSRDEPFGIVLLEAMARGIPILATRTAGPSEILDDDSAFLTTAGDPAGLAAAIRAALDAPDRARRAAAALARFRRCYSPAPVVAAYVALYERLSG